jgi:hypothetical protein
MGQEEEERDQETVKGRREGGREVGSEGGRGRCLKRRGDGLGGSGYQER